MSRVTAEPPNPRPRLFTRDEYWSMGKLGFFDSQRVELIGGEIVEMAAQSNTHGAGITITRIALERAFGAGFWVQTQQTLDLSPLSQPDPDVAVVPGDPYHPAPHPATSAVLIVEVSETTLRTDRGRKASLYAASGIADYWIVNLPDRQLEIRRDPRPDATEEFGWGYASLTTLRPGDLATPVAAPNANLAVADLFPA